MKQNRNIKIKKQQNKRGFRYITIKVKIILSVKMKLRTSLWNQNKKIDRDRKQDRELRKLKDQLRRYNQFQRERKQKAERMKLSKKLYKEFSIFLKICLHVERHYQLPTMMTVYKFYEKTITQDILFACSYKGHNNSGGNMIEMYFSLLYQSKHKQHNYSMVFRIQIPFISLCCHS